MKEAASGVLGRTPPCDVPRQVRLGRSLCGLVHGFFERPAGFPQFKGGEAHTAWAFA